MNKTDLIRSISDSTGLKNTEATRVVDAVFPQLRDEVLVADLQELRGAALVAVGLLQRLPDLQSLDFRNGALGDVVQRPAEIEFRPWIRRFRSRSVQHLRIGRHREAYRPALRV